MTDVGLAWLPLLLLLHEGGWDEVLMVAVGLGLAYAIIMFTGRRSRDDDDDDDEADDFPDETSVGRDADHRDDPPAPADARPDERRPRA